ncbi:MAG: hypothetical protein AAF810_21965 [Cyanobacteria bacterium P01_D01_bin.36]
MKKYLRQWRGPSVKGLRQLGFLFTALFLLCIILLPLFPQPAVAQPEPIRRVSPSVLSARVYEQLPNFPLENQYISSETGNIDTNNTLASRFIRYHIYIQNRPTNFRLDWKLTLADYLGAFERISPNRYADYGLRENPLSADIAAIESLSPSQRNTFINTLYETFTTPISTNDDASEPSSGLSSGQSTVP